MKMFCSSSIDSCEAGSHECRAISRLNHTDIGTPECPVLARLRNKDVEGPERSILTRLSNKEPGGNGLSFSSQKCWNRFTSASCSPREAFQITDNFSKCNNNNDCDDNINHSAERVECIGSGSFPNDRSIGFLNHKEFSPRLKELLEGLNEPGDSCNPPTQPEWLDHELFDRGRKFYEKYFFCIFFSDLLSLLVVLAQRRILRPLIYTDKSDTPIRALRRYVSTIQHVITWFSGDVWNPNDKAHKDILHVRNIHINYASIFNSSENYDDVQSINVKDKGHSEPKCPFSAVLRHDLEMQTGHGISLESPDNPPLYVSQWDMAFTQYCFLGIMLAHPKQMGAWGATEEELEGFVHFWRGIGWLLGIEDKYNFCRGTAAETKALCAEMERFVVVPSLSKSDWNHEHMSFSLMEGINMMVPGMSFPAMFRFLADTLGLSVPLFIRSMSLKHTFQYWLLSFFLHVAFLMPGVLYIFNQLLKIAVRTIQEKHPSWFPESRKGDFVNT